MSVFPRPKIADYWRTEAVYYSPIYNSVMSRNRFQLVTRLLHFADNTFWNPKYENHDKLYKIRPILDYLGSRFQSVYTPTKLVHVDQEILLHPGKNSSTPSYPSSSTTPSSKRKRTSNRKRRGMKFVNLRDETGYLYKTECYVGNDFYFINQAGTTNFGGSGTETNPSGSLEKHGRVVMRLMEDLLGKGHHLYVNNR